MRAERRRDPRKAVSRRAMSRASDGKREPTRAQTASLPGAAEPPSEPRRQWNFCSPSPTLSQTSEGMAMLRPHSWTNDFDCQLTPSVCPHAPGDSTDMPDSLSAVEIQDRRHDWLDKNVPTHSSPATGTRQASVPGVKVTPNERGYSPDVDSGKDSGRQHRHRSRSRSRTSRTTAAGVGSEALSANSDRRRRSEGYSRQHRRRASTSSVAVVGAAMKVAELDP